MAPQPGNRIDLLRFSLRRQLPVVLQSEVSECALACLAMISAYHGCSLSLAEHRRRFNPSLSGSSLGTIEKAACTLGLSMRSLRLDLHELSKLQQPAILHWHLDHFVVLHKVHRKGISVHDPAVGRRFLNWSDVSRYFTGVALELYPVEGFTKTSATEQVRILDLCGRAHGLWSSLGQILLLSTMLQLLVVLAPLVNQFMVDEAIAKNDARILRPLLLGFGILMITQAAIEALRSIAGMYFGQMLSFQLRSNLLWHLFRLPAGFFAKRHIGDVVSRLDSLGPIQNLLSSAIVTVILDGFLAVVTLIVMYLYSPVLALVVIMAAILGFIARLSIFPHTRRLLTEEIHADAKRQSILLESIRSIRAVKLFSQTTKRHRIWQNAFIEVTNIGIRLQKLGIATRSGSRLLSGALDISVLYVGATAVMSGSMTLGMLFAFQTYRAQFSNRLRALVEQYFVFRTAGIHLQRLADIVQAETEPPGPIQPTAILSKQPKVIGRDIRFRYGDDQPWILDGVNLVIEPGERVALTGLSGGGKSTLLRVLLGFHDTQAGEIFFDGIPLHMLGLENARQLMGVVMQHDRLLSGTLTDNISFSDEHIDFQRVIQATKTAEIYDDIVAMPMGFDSLIGDMGSALSGGQQQRILLARALYKKPRILLLDEGTANLDETTEANVLNNLASLGLSQLIIAHRPAAIAACDRVVSLCDGKLY